MKSQAIRSPLVMGIAGALLGAAAARLIRNATARTRVERIEWESADDQRGVGERIAGKAGEVGAELKDRASDLGATIKDKASGLGEGIKENAAALKERAGQLLDATRERIGRTASEIDERLPSVDEIKDRAGAAYRWTTEEQPAIGALLAIGAGVALGCLLPVSEKEQKILAPVRRRAAENLGDLEDKVRELSERLDDQIAGESKRPQT